jgi:DNA-3-methyladenine glycosylase II
MNSNTSTALQRKSREREEGLNQKKSAVRRNEFFLEPAAPFRLDLTVWTLRRRPDNVVDRWDGQTYRRVLPLQDGLVEVAVTQVGPPETSRLKVSLKGQPLRSRVKENVTLALERLLGLRIDLAGFYRLAAREKQLGELALRFRGMRPPRYATVFESVIVGIASQQVSRTVSILVLNRLTAAYGSAFHDEGAPAHAFPRPVDVAGLRPSELRPLGFSRQKERAITELAQSVAGGSLDLEELAQLPDEEAIKRLCSLRGVGRWTAEYVLLRGLGRTHIFPGDDVGARNNLKRWLGLEQPLDYETVRRTLERWHPYAGLIYFHMLLDRLEEAGFLQTEPPQARDGQHIPPRRKTKT